MITLGKKKPENNKINLNIEKVKEKVKVHIKELVFENKDEKLILNVKIIEQIIERNDIKRNKLKIKIRLDQIININKK